MEIVNFVHLFTPNHAGTTATNVTVAGPLWARDSGAAL
jgi:hypothetical protein